MTKKKNKYKNVTCVNIDCGVVFNTRASGVLAEVEMCRKCVVKILKGVREQNDASKS